MGKIPCKVVNINKKLTFINLNDKDIVNNPKKYKKGQIDKLLRTSVEPPYVYHFPSDTLCIINPLLDVAVSKLYGDHPKNSYGHIAIYEYMSRVLQADGQVPDI